MSVIANNIVAGAAGQGGAAAAFQIDRSIRLNSADTAYLNFTPSSQSNRRTWTISFWIKKVKNDSNANFYRIWGQAEATHLYFYQDNLHFDISSTTAGSAIGRRWTNQVFRDNSAWQHVVAMCDTTASTASERLRLYINGVEVTSFSNTTNPSQDADTSVNTTNVHTIGYRTSAQNSAGGALDAYLAEIHFVDGTALAASDFGEYDDNSVWQPKAFANAGPNNGTQWSSNSTNFTNPGKGFNGNSGDYAEVSSSGAKGTFTFPSSITVSSNVTFAFSSGTSGNLFVNDSSTAMQGTSFQVQTISFTGTLTKISLQSSSQPVLYYFAVDGVPLIDNLSHNYGVNGFNLKFADNSSNAALGTDSSGNSNTWTVNNLVATAGLATAAQGFDVVTYTGNGSTQSISGLAFQPDFVWVKRGNSASDHQLYDSVRGANKGLSTNLTSAEWTYSGGLSSFDSTGFSVGNLGGLNGSSDTHVAWCWKAGGTASSNTDGSITSSVSANSTYGFSIVSYTGNGSNATIGHGLSSAPKVIIKKFRSASSSWDVYHESVGAGKRLVLNSAATEASTSSYQNVNSSTFDVHAGNNDNGVPMIAYCWSEIAGFSKFGEYSGGCSSSVTVTTGFKPKFVIIKGKDVDSSPSGYRGWGMYQEPKTSQQLMAHCSGEEGVRGNCDTGSSKRDIQANVVFNNDGFTVDSCWFEQNDNTSGAKYVYMAFADKPPGEIVDSLIDTPTNYEADSGNNGGNYATLNPLAIGSNVTLSEGNLHFSSSTTSGYRTVLSTIGMSSGKWYCEVDSTNSSSVGLILGIALGSMNVNTWLGGTSDSWGYYEGQQKYHNGSGSTYGASFGVGDIIGIAFDADNGTLTFYKNGSSQGNAYTGLSSDTYFFAVSDGGSTTASCNVNFGQRPFAYTPPTGYKSLCTTNLADPTIADGSTAMDVALWTANGSSQTISGLNFSPDLVWAKSRNTGTTPHLLVDTVRGASQVLSTHTTGAEEDYSGISGVISAFNSDGFDTGGNSDIATNNRTFVGWTWDGGTSNSSISVGSLNSSAYFMSQTWSNGLSGLSNSSITNPANAFNGSEDGYADSTAGFTLDLSGYTFGTGTHTIELKSGGGTSFTVNGTTSLSTTGSSGAIVWTGTHTGELTSIVSSATGASLYYLKIDGKLLVDSGTSVTNVPSIASTVRANTSAGFSIVTATQGSGNSTWGHGLNAKPDFIVMKARDQSYAWYVSHSGLDNQSTKFLRFDASAVLTNANWFASTEPTSSVITSKAGGMWNSGDDFVAYCWNAVEGYSAFGSYTGNGSSDGPFVYTGFRPNWILIKNADTANNWLIYDAVRNSFNPTDLSIQADEANTETNLTNDEIDILSNGFKVRCTRGDLNTSGDAITFAAFAEHPFKTARAA